MRSHSRGRIRPAFVLGLSMCIGPAAFAGTDYPVSGSITVNGTEGPLPAGGAFVGSSYDEVSGEIGAGVFEFPVATVDFDSPVGVVTATYELTQADSSSGHVDADGFDLCALGEELKDVDPARGLDGDLAGLGVAAVVEQLGGAVDAVAAVLRLGSVRVDEPHAEIRPVGGQRQDQAIPPNPEVPVADAPGEVREGGLC